MAPQCRFLAAPSAGVGRSNYLGWALTPRWRHSGMLGQLGFLVGRFHDSNHMAGHVRPARGRCRMRVRSRFRVGVRYDQFHGIARPSYQVSAAAGYRSIMALPRPGWAPQPFGQAPHRGACRGLAGSAAAAGAGCQSAHSAERIHRLPTRFAAPCSNALA
jgi:hypothetical protein